MIKSLAAAAVLAFGMSSVAFADDAPAAAKPAMSKSYMCYHTVKGKKVWHKSSAPCAGSKMKMKKM